MKEKEGCTKGRKGDPRTLTEFDLGQRGAGTGKVLTQDAVLQLPVCSHIWVRGPQHGKGLGVLALGHFQGETGTPKGGGMVILILYSHSHCDMGQQRG